MKQPITSTIIVATTAVALAYSSYRLNKYCAILPVTKLGCKIFCTVPQTLAMKIVLRNREILAFLIGRKLGYI